ncbi:MAG: hypothetical protein GY804_09710 [Alphaproteobacteria bacterium]|nr:hypothetical protein [Alphaproteobacteria bacterium]
MELLFTTLIHPFTALALIGISGLSISLSIVINRENKDLRKRLGMEEDNEARI